ncbi:MAG: phosphatase PAP2 family protein [Acidobacteria bacterium]|nr:phosphatase PAP2 family protein [Acidobacteriota bacterium]
MRRTFFASFLAVLVSVPAAAGEPAAVRQLRLDLETLVTVDHPPTALETALGAALFVAVAADDSGLAATGRHHLPGELRHVESWGRVGAANTVGVTLVVGGLIAGRTRGWVGGLTLLEGNLLLGVALNLSKQAFGRARPFERHAGRLRQGGESFPSSHAAHAFLIAAVLDATVHRTGWRWVFYPAASAVALSRVQTGVHFPTDVIAGGALGWWIGHRLSVAHHLDDNIRTQTTLAVLPTHGGMLLLVRREW